MMDFPLLDKLLVPWVIVSIKTHWSNAVMIALIRRTEVTSAQATLQNLSGIRFPLKIYSAIVVNRICHSKDHC